MNVPKATAIAPVHEAGEVECRGDGQASQPGAAPLHHRHKEGRAKDDGQADELQSHAQPAVDALAGPPGTRRVVHERIGVLHKALLLTVRTNGCQTLCVQSWLGCGQH